MPDILDPTTNNDLKTILDATRSFLDNMKDGERVLLPIVIDHIAQTTTLDRPAVAALVPSIIRAHEGVMIKKGPNGGVIKGELPPKRVDMRPRCETCNQVVRFPKKEPTIEE